MMEKKIRIMLIEDSPEYRDVIDFALTDDPEIKLESTFSTAEIALRALQNLAPGTAPDLILLDLNLPGMSGLEAIPWIEKYVPATQIIILTQSDKQADILSAIAQGAAGYLLKSSTVDQVKDGIRTVVNGGASLDSDIARFIINTLQGKLPKTKKESLLSKKEINVLALLADGLHKKEISGELKISVNTVDSHVRHIYEKLNVQNAPAAISKAFLSGILPTGK